MKNTCVMFGAGAEAVFGIATGVNFAASVLGIEAITMNSAIKDYYRNILPQFSDWYPTFTLDSWKEEDLLTVSVKKSILEGNFQLTFRKDYEEEVKERVSFLRNNDIEKKIIMENYLGYMGLIGTSSRRSTPRTSLKNQVVLRSHRVLPLVRHSLRSRRT